MKAFKKLDLTSSSMKMNNNDSAKTELLKQISWMISSKTSVRDDSSSRSRVSSMLLSMLLENISGDEEKKIIKPLMIDAETQTQQSEESAGSCDQDEDSVAREETVAMGDMITTEKDENSSEDTEPNQDVLECIQNEYHENLNNNIKGRNVSDDTKKFNKFNTYESQHDRAVYKFDPYCSRNIRRRSPSSSSSCSGRSRSRSPSIRRRSSSPCFLDTRRITSARRLPVPLVNHTRSKKRRISRSR